MRKRYRVLIFAALVAALVVPVGFALSLESPTPIRTSDALVSAGWFPVMSDSMRLFLVGTLLIGLGMVARKAN